jgi:hypothetical protein
MFARIRHTACFATVSLLAAAILVPAAAAGRWGPAGPPHHATAQRQSNGPCHQYCSTIQRIQGQKAPAAHSLVRTELVSSSDSFRWADAGIGFAVACAGMLLIFLTLGAARRTRVRHASSAS